MFSSKDLFFTPAVSTGYTVSKSLRFRSGSSTYFNRTPSTASGSSRRIWTWSGWVKRGTLSTNNNLLSAGLISGTYFYTRLYFDSNNNLVFYNYPDTASIQATTAAVYRDPSAWYHIVLSVDTTQATNSNGVRIWVNGVSQTLTFANYAQNADTMFNTTSYANWIGKNVNGGTNDYFDGYMAEVNFIDASAKIATDFGAYDTNGIWQPAAYTGSYGTNGYYLKFTDVGATSGSNTGYGKDFAGTNYFTTNNFGTTSTLTTYDSMLDSPTNAAGDIGNYCIINPLSQRNSSTVANGNLTGTLTAYSGAPNLYGSQSVSSGKYYWEITYTSYSGNKALAVGIVNNNAGMPLVDMASGSAGVWYYSSDGNKRVNGAASSYGATYDTGDVIGVALDVDTPQITFYKNNTSQGSFSIPSSGTWTPGCWNGTSSGNQVFDANFGQRGFKYTPPSGYSALNTQNLTTPTITNGAQYMAAVTYTGNSSSTGNVRSITTTSSNSGNNPNGTTFQPDFVWVKNRSNAYRHNLYDVVRGAGSSKNLSSSSTDIEGVDASLYGYVSAYNSDGFQVTNGTDASFAGIWVNQNTQTYVGWQWRAGGSTLTTGSGTGGITNVQYSVNQSAGFSIIKYSGSGTAGTITHGLGAAPSFVIVKTRNLTAKGWPVFHISNGAGGYTALNSTAAYTADTNMWGNTAPNSTTISFGTDSWNNGSTGNYICYAWAPISQFSSFGSYTGNGSADGAFVYLGFRPRWLLIKRTDTTDNWRLFDSTRAEYNDKSNVLYPNLDNTEDASTGIHDFLSNGFKNRSATANNISGGTYVYAAFAENPFKIARAR